VGDTKKQPLYGSLRAHETAPEAEVMKDELLLFGWAAKAGPGRGFGG
jgi:hypothetical protein